MRNRYDVSGLPETRFEPRSRGRVLRNALGIYRKREMDSVEAEHLAKATDWAIRHYDADHRLLQMTFACCIGNGWARSIRGLVIIGRSTLARADLPLPWRRRYHA